MCLKKYFFLKGLRFWRLSSHFILKRISFLLSWTVVYSVMLVSDVQHSDSDIGILFQILFSYAAAAAKSLQSCPTLCDPIDGSSPSSPIPGILQAKTRERVAISFSNAGKWKVKVKSLSLVRPSATPWTAAHQAPPSMGFSRQEYWSGVPLPSPLFSYRVLQNTEYSPCATQ